MGCLKNVLLKLLEYLGRKPYLGIKLFPVCSSYNPTVDVHVVH